jgi:serine/threonine-protein kinase RsbW
LVFLEICRKNILATQGMGLNMKTYEMVIPSKSNQIQKVEQYAEKLAHKIGFAEDEIDGLAIAITEVTANAIYHGNKSDPNKKVYVRFTTLNDSMTITVRDEGKGFDPKKIADPSKPENLLKDSGRGIYIIRALMDEVSFNFSKGGTEITLVKKKK